MKKENYTVLAYNQKKAEAAKKLKKHSLGKGKIWQTIDKIAISACAVLEVIRELPGFDYLKSATIGNITTKFNLWLSQIFAETPDLTGLTPQQIYNLASQNAIEGAEKMANSWGLIFSAVLEFVLTHPTVTVIGVVTLTSILVVPFKFLINKIKQVIHGKDVKIEEKDAKVVEEEKTESLTR